MDVVIERAVESDADELAQLRLDYSREGEGEQTPVPSDFLESLAQQIRGELSDGSSVIWVARRPHGIVSVAWVKLIRKALWPSAPSAWWGYVTNVYTVPTVRGRGIGAQLMRALMRWAEHEHLEFLILWPSERSLSWYRRLGFVRDPEALMWAPGTAVAD